MAIEGPLRELGIHDVFQLLDLSRKTGVLRVTSELRDDHGIVMFDTGRVVHASIRSKPAPIELALLQAGKITEDELQVAYGAGGEANGSRRSGPEVIDVLMEQGAITPRELERWLRLQIEGVVFELMSWREGFFSFEERPPGEISRDARIKVSTESLLMEGARRIDEWSRIAHRVPSLSVIPHLAPLGADHPDSHLDLLPNEWEVLAMIDGNRDLRGIAATLGVSEFEVAKVVYGLVTTGVVTVKAPERASVVTMAALEGRGAVLERGQRALRRGAFEEALASARAACSERDDTEGILLASRALSGLGRHADAVHELRRAVQVDPVDAHLHAQLGFAALQTGDFSTARASWENYLRVAPTAPDVGRVRAALETMTRLEMLIEAHSHV